MARTIGFRRLKTLLARAWAMQELRIGPEQWHEAQARHRRMLPGRREFLKTSALALAAAPGSPWSLVFPAPRRSDEPVLILGAGAAGLAAAYQLTKNAVPFLLVEATRRVGGRIATEQKFNTDLQFIERGAELVDSNHTVLMELAAELGLELETFASGDEGPVPTLYHFGGKLHTEEEFVAGVGPLIERIKASSEEIYGESDESILYRTREALPNAARYDHMTLREYLDSISSEVEPWIRQAVETAYLGEFGRETTEQSAINLIDLIDLDVSDGFSMFGDSDEAMRVKGGNSRLTQRMFDALKDQGRTPEEKIVRMEHVLRAVRRAGDSILCVFDHRGKTVEQKSAQVICTIPFTTLREVEGLGELGLSAVKLECINRLGYGTNTKVMIAFKTRFWRKPHSGVPANTGSVYGDFPSQNLWETSRLQPGNQGILTAFLGGAAGLDADSDSVGQALQSLGRLYPGSMVKEQYDDVKVVMNWSKMPYAKGSFGCLMPGQYTSIWGAAHEPELEGRLLFAGEHTSLDFQGYMNGAYETGIRAATEALEHRNA